jgi:hypothetical protein
MRCISAERRVHFSQKLIVFLSNRELIEQEGFINCYAGKKIKRKLAPDYTGKLMEYWTIYCVVVLKLGLQLGAMAHYCVSPTAPIYPGSLILAWKGRYEYTFVLILTGISYWYYAMLVMNAFLFYDITIYFDLSKFTK